jgi:hypothetical protein
MLDGSPIDDDIMSDPELDESTLIESRRSVLAAPVAELVIRRDEANGLWFKIDEEVATVCDYEGMAFFLHLLEIYASNKQLDSAE